MIPLPGLVCTITEIILHTLMAIGYTDLPMLIAKDKANGDFPAFRKSNISVSLCGQIASNLLCRLD